MIDRDPRAGDLEATRARFETLGCRWETVQSAAATVQSDPCATIRPAGPVETAERLAVELLRHLASEHEGAGAHLHLEGTLGQGGMGIVRLATQQTMGRKVAVKTLRPERRSEASTVELLQEAWVTGALEHPNVVPVYDIGLDDTGGPMIILRRIEGTEWSALAADPAAIRERFGEAPEVWHLRVFMQVCNAIHFAHSRGIVHRDIKPDNVMIGPFGEVYVLDWGIAVALADDGSGRLPLAENEREMAGTPAFMAPEMLGPSGPECSAGLSARTDVYLLGATLYTVLTGRPPHDARSGLAVLRQVVESKPIFPADLPDELQALCRRAMAADPAARFESAEAMRLAAHDFLERRGSRRLAAEALEGLARLEGRLEGGAGEADRRALYDLFGGCRFGFRQALATWPENPGAQAGLRDAAALMVAYELDCGKPDTAADLLAELPDPPPALAARVEAAQANAAAERAALARLGEEHDPRVGQRTRVFLLCIFAGVVTLIPLLEHWLYDLRSAAYTTTMLCGLGVAVGFIALGWWARESMTATVINRSVLHTVLFVLLAQFALDAGCYLAGQPALLGVILRLFLWFSAASLYALLSERRLWPAALVYLLAFLGGALRPEWVFLLMSATNLCLLINGLAIWLPGMRASRRAPSRGGGH